MTSEEVHKLLEEGDFPLGCENRNLVETHISWVILSDRFVFKIKKPIRYSFLDFSTIVKRKYYCLQEVKLNRRLTQEMYIGVVPIVFSEGNYAIYENKPSGIVDYAVMMHRMDRGRQMDALLKKGAVQMDDIRQVAQVLVDFHKNTEIIYRNDLLDLHHYFDDLLGEKDFVQQALSKEAAKMIDHCAEKAEHFVDMHYPLLKKRMENGFVRDCHGDLHSRNIFLYEKPVIFDCIEFNPGIRQIDLLNELAFFCMDLEAFGYENLSKAFITYYNSLFNVIHVGEEELLFAFFKAYRANVRAKVNALRAKSASGEERDKALSECMKYLKLMCQYTHQFDRSPIPENH